MVFKVLETEDGGTYSIANFRGGVIVLAEKPGFLKNIPELYIVMDKDIKMGNITKGTVLTIGRALTGDKNKIKIKAIKRVT